MGENKDQDIMIIVIESILTCVLYILFTMELAIC